MNGYYQCDDRFALNRVKQQQLKSADPSPYRRRTTFREETPAKPPSAAVWNVVSSLVQALSDARDELLTLLTSDGVRKPTYDPAGRHNNSRSPSRSPRRPFSAPSCDLRRSRIPIQAAGDYGRIRSSHSSDSQKPRKITRTTSTCNYNDSPPVSFGMDLQFESVRRGRSPPAGFRRAGGRYQPMTLNQRGITPHGLEYISAVPAGHGERRRNCTATRFADLLQAETCHLKERRLAEESVATLRSKPSWY